MRSWPGSLIFINHRLPSWFMQGTYIHLHILFCSLPNGRLTGRHPYHELGAPDQEREAPRPRARLPDQEPGSQTKVEAPRPRSRLLDQERGSQTKSEAPRPRARLPDQERGSQTKSEAPRPRSRLLDQERGFQIKSEAPRPRAYSWRNYRKGVLEECLSRSGGINRSYGKLYPTWLRYDSKLAGLVRFSYERKLNFMCINQGKQISWLAGLVWTDS
jgi:hypothetical protein